MVLQHAPGDRLCVLPAGEHAHPRDVPVPKKSTHECHPEGARGTGYENRPKRHGLTTFSAIRIRPAPLMAPRTKPVANMVRTTACTFR